MKKLRNILLAAGVLTMAACNDTANDGANNDGTTAGSEVKSDTNTTANNTGTTTTLAQRDAQFVNDAAASNMAEVKMAQLALQKGTSQEVKDIAKMLETDHSAALGELRTFASGKSVTLPAEEKDDDKNMHNTLNGKSGKEFDKEWCRHMIDAHQKAISMCESAQNEVTDTDLKTWASNTLPKLRTHLDRVRECEKKLK